MKAIATIALSLLTAAGALAQSSSPCPTGEDLPRIPELVSKDGVLRGTVVAVAETQSIGTRNPASAPAPGAVDQCYPQTVRAMKGVGTDQPYPPTPPSGAAEPLPGPTLRARVGELVQLTFLNQIDMNRFPKSLDKGQCDQVSGFYPQSSTSKKQDIYPNCFHGSTTANIHFHGTHVNPNSTGDNVFVEIRPSLRTHDAANKPLVTQASVKKDFEEFFRACAAELKPTKPTKEWPKTWAGLPKHFTEEQERLLKLYDKEVLGDENKKLWLWPTDARQRAQGLWPQYYVGAFPYCYRIPEYVEAPQLTSPDAHAVHAHGKGSAEENVEADRPLQMGQAPGTHWYHAHKHGSTTIDISNGMVGAFIIEGQYDDDLNAFYGKNWTRTAKVMVINQLGTSPNLERGGKGQDKGATFSVNGRYKPVVHMRPGEVQMWRIVNSSSRAGAYIASFPSGFHWKQLAQDGVQFIDANYQKSGTGSLLLASGNRVDLLVMAPTAATTQPVALQVQYEVDPQDLGSAQLTTLLSISVDGSAASGNQTKFIPTAPAFPKFLDDVTDAEIQGTKSIVFASKPPTLGKQHTIDGKQFSGEVGAVVLLNQAEEWKVSNETYGPPISHPFHIHLNPFQISAKFDPNAALSTTTGAGSITVTAPKEGNQIVTGTGTSFTTALNVGDWIWVGGSRATVIKISSDTQAELPNGSIGAVATATPYQIAVPRYTIAAPRTGQCRIDPKDAKPCGPTEQARDRIWWDVFPIPSGNTFYDANGENGTDVPGWFKLRSRFVDYSGYYVLHCHILAHEDRGMMTVVEVAPLQSPYSHH
jgi:FtsP/CotA-like multicopper oxidase with cupredoxin domain